MFLLTFLDGTSKSSIRIKTSVKIPQNKIPLDLLIHLWLGHKKVLGFGPLRKGIYSDSLNKDSLLGAAKKYVLKYDNVSLGVEYIFGPHAKIIIPALIEMGIFEKVVAELLEEEKFSDLERRKKVVELISKLEIYDTLRQIEDDTRDYLKVNGVEVSCGRRTFFFITARKDFISTID